MSSWLVGLIGGAYLCVAADMGFKGKIGKSLMWFGYAIANVGLVIDMKESCE